MNPLNKELSIVLSGEAGQGIQSIESMLTAFAKNAAYHVFATKEYMSRVRGGCNSTEIRISRERVTARVGRIDILIPLTPESIPHLRERISAETVVIGEKAVVGYDRMIDLPFAAIALEVGGVVYSNTVAVGAICALLRIDRAGCEAGVREFFGGKSAEIQDSNVEAFRRGYERGSALVPEVAIDIQTDPAVGDEIMLTGAEAVSLGAVAGGCDYVCAYPMSPGTTVLTAMAEYSRRFDIIVEQVEDEIGVANMAIGAWYAGARALVTTSGGGFALMSEAVSLSGAIETPLVVHIAQRPGPATGLPTRTEQGDLNLAIHAGHGDFLKVVLAPGDLEEGFSLTRAAFDIADRYQSPVFILTDQFYVDSYYTTPPFDVPDAPPERHTVRTSADYRRYALGSADGLSPRGLPGMGEGIVCVDSDEHDEGGYITEDTAMRKAMVAKRLAKIAAVRKDILPPRLYGDPRYRVLILGWGSVKRPVMEAMAAIGLPYIAYLHFPWVYPLPDGVAEYMAAASTCIAVEGNAGGQFADLVEFETGKRIDHRILKNDGFQFTVEELVEKISALA
ncbi:MAG: 2-oxoacid:acceptor oxidoreductase subunit alpha [Rectinemataceae bacterium]